MIFGHNIPECSNGANMFWFQKPPPSGKCTPHTHTYTHLYTRASTHQHVFSTIARMLQHFSINFPVAYAAFLAGGDKPEKSPTGRRALSDANRSGQHCTASTGTIASHSAAISRGVWAQKAKLQPTRPLHTPPTTHPIYQCCIKSGLTGEQSSPARGTGNGVFFYTFLAPYHHLNLPFALRCGRAFYTHRCTPPFACVDC